MALAAAGNMYAISIGGTGSVLPIGTPGCSAIDYSANPADPSCTAIATQLSPGGTVTGVGLSTSGLVPLTGGGDAELTLSASGPLTGSSLAEGVAIPLYFDFSAQLKSAAPGASITGWHLDFQLLDGGTVIGDSGALVTAYLNPANISGTSSLTTTASADLGDTITEQVTLDVYWNSGDGGNTKLAINVPAGSFDYESTGSAAPEPGTLGLAGLGLILGVWSARRRRRSIA